MKYKQIEKIFYKKLQENYNNFLWDSLGNMKNVDPKKILEEIKEDKPITSTNLRKNIKKDK